MFRLTFDQEKQLIDFFRENPSLWHTKDKDYNNRSLRTQKLETVATHLRLTRKDVYEKYRNLRTTFFREHKRVLQSSTSSNNSSNFDGSPSTDNGNNSSNGPAYISKWRHYNNMLFLTKTGAGGGGDGSYRTSSKNSDIAAGDDDDSTTSDHAMMQPQQRQRQLSANLQNGHGHSHDIELVENNGNSGVPGGGVSIGGSSASQVVILQHPKISRHLSATTQPIEILSANSSSANSVDLNSLVQTNTNNNNNNNNNSHHLHHNEEQLIYVNESNGTVTLASGRPMIATSNGTAVHLVNANNLQLQSHHPQHQQLLQNSHHRLISSSPIRTSTTSLPQQLSISPIVSSNASASATSSATSGHSMIYTAASTGLINPNNNRQIFKAEPIENFHETKISPNILLKNLPFATTGAAAAADLNSFLQKQLPTSSSTSVLSQPQIIAKTSIGTSAAAALQQFQQSASSSNRKSSLLLLTKPDGLGQPMAAFVSASNSGNSQQQTGSASAGGQFLFGAASGNSAATLISQNNGSSSNNNLHHHNGILINGFAGGNSSLINSGAATASSTPTSGTMDYSEMREVIKTVVQDTIVDYEDAEMAFCRSLAASLRTLDRSKKDVAKLELQQVIVRYTNPSYACVSSQSQPSASGANVCPNNSIIKASGPSTTTTISIASLMTNNSQQQQQQQKLSSDIINNNQATASDHCPTSMETDEVQDGGDHNSNTSSCHNENNDSVPSTTTTTTSTTIDNNSQSANNHNNNDISQQQQTNS